MTRKCVLCKETNYKNAYSFFSAPKDEELRKKWQKAIGIENYSVTDDTYVCSKHFHKDDIITHWVSGVPPHVITIKYKKCRLRPGAIPGRNYHLNCKDDNQENSGDSDIQIEDYPPFKLKKINLSEEDEKHFLIAKPESKLKLSNDEAHRIASLHRQSPHEFNDSTRKRKECNDPLKISVNKVESSGNGSKSEESKVKESLEKNLRQAKENKTAYLKEESNDSSADLMKDIGFKVKSEVENQVCREDSDFTKLNKMSESSRAFNTSNGDETSLELWDSKLRKNDTLSKEDSMGDFEKTENIYIKSEVVDNSNDDDELNACSPLYNDMEETEMLFEDLLEVCTEVLLPRGWSCLVTSKGRTTTIVYLYMGMTKGGMPYTEKQVFIKSDMMLHCAAVNGEINPFDHNLIKEGKHIKVQSLLDIEELIDEFDQRIICQGIYTTEGSQDVRDIKTVYKDGIKWRHVLCPLLVNTDSSRCTRCAALSRVLQRRARSSLSSFYTSTVFTKKQQKAYTIRQKCKRMRRHDRRYESKAV